MFNKMGIKVAFLGNYFNQENIFNLNIFLDILNLTNFIPLYTNLELS